MQVLRFLIIVIKICFAKKKTCNNAASLRKSNDWNNKAEKLHLKLCS